MHETFRWGEYPPAYEYEYGDADDSRHEYPCDLVYNVLDRSLASLGILNHFHYLGEDCVFPCLLGPEPEGSGQVDGSCVDLVSCGFPGWKRLSVEHTFIHIRFPFHHCPVHGYPLSRSDHYYVSSPCLFNRYRHFRCFLSSDDGYSTWLQPGKFTDGISRLPLCPVFKQPAEQDECYDDTGCFEI